MVTLVNLSISECVPLIVVTSEMDTLMLLNDLSGVTPHAIEPYPSSDPLMQSLSLSLIAMVNRVYTNITKVASCTHTRIHTSKCYN